MRVLVRENCCMWDMDVVGLLLWLWLPYSSESTFTLLHSYLDLFDSSSVHTSSTFLVCNSVMHVYCCM